MVTLLVCNDLVAIADPAGLFAVVTVSLPCHTMLLVHHVDNAIRSLLHFPVRCAELPSTGDGHWVHEGGGC